MEKKEIDRITNKPCILITGICGEIGSNFAEWLTEHHPEYDVIGLDNLSDGYLENIDLSKITFYLRNAQDDLTDIFERHNIEYCYSMAAFCAEGLSPFVRKFSYTNNIIITANIVNHCVKYGCKLIYLSSMSVYGIGKPPFSEVDDLKPIDPYGVAKLASEMDIQIAGKQHGLQYSIIRPHNVIGTRCNIWSKYRNVIGRWMYQLLHGEPLTIYGDGQQTRAFSWVKDYCEPFWNVGHKNYAYPIFNVGGDQHYKLVDVAKMLNEITGIDTGIKFLEPRHEVFEAYCDHSKAKVDLGFIDKTPLTVMLSEMWEWAKLQPDRPVKVWDEYELDVGIYEFWKK